MAKTPSVKSKAKILKDLGVVNYDLRRKLHPSSKKKIERLFNEWSYVANHKEEMTRRQVSPATAKLLKESGYSVNPKNQVFLLQEPGDTVRIKDGFVTYERRSGDTETIILPARGDFLRQLERMKRRDLKRNELLTLKVGEYRNVNWQFRSFEELQHYVRTTKWKSENVTQYLSVVAVKVDSDYDEESGEDTPVFQRRTDVERKKPNAKKPRARRSAGR